MNRTLHGIGAAMALATSLFAAPSAALAGQSAAAAASASGGPACGTISGTSSVAFTTNEGKTIVLPSRRPSETTETWGLVALDTPGWLLAESNGNIIRSRDAGCTWETLTTVQGRPLRLVSGGGNRAYGWTDNNNYFVRFTDRSKSELRQPLSAILGMGVDKVDGKRVRIGGDNGDVWESLDAGDTWNRVGVAPAGGDITISYRMDFDPNDINHIVLGRATEGSYVTFDGGRNWARSAMPLTGSTNIFNLVTSPVDGNVVWATGIYLPHVDYPNRGRYLLRSTDGGRTFGFAARENRYVTIINGPVMAAHPTNKNVVYWVYGSYLFNGGTDLYRYDSATNAVTKTHNAIDDVNAITFNKQNPSVMYLGIEQH